MAVPFPSRTPPYVRRFGIEHLAAFDDEALRTFLGVSGVVEPEVLGTALHGLDAEAAGRVLRALPLDDAVAAAGAYQASPSPDTVETARRRVVERLFWDLLYWHEPALYDELIAGEWLHPELVAALEVDGRDVCDIGAGTGRFTLVAAERARRVIAVDAVEPMLERLRALLLRRGVRNVECLRGSYLELPLHDGEVEVAVACSSLSARDPHAGEAALHEMQRVVRSGGQLVVIWPDDAGWFVQHGFEHRRYGDGAGSVHFPTLEAARRLCAAFYGDDAARWVDEHGSAAVPYAVLGMRAPDDLCIKQVP